jgi:tetratricopeptide (TPR) repeat protein
MLRPLVIAAALTQLTSLALAQKPPTAQQKKAAKAHYQQGTAFYEAGGYDDAVREYQEAYALVPLPELLFNIAQCHRMKGNKPKAIEAYQRYLEKVTEGPLAEEARTHVASLQLKIQVEEAEAARKKAAEEVEAARKRATEAEEARKRIEAEAAARLKALRTDEERLMRLAEEQREREKRAKAAEEADYRRRLREAEGRGKVLRIIGSWTIVGGCMTIAASIVPMIFAANASDKIREWDDDKKAPWSDSLNKSIADQDRAVRNAIIVTSVGGALMVGGIVVYRIGVYKRNRAVEEVEQPAVSVVPIVGPGVAALGVSGRF